MITDEGITALGAVGLAVVLTITAAFFVGAFYLWLRWLRIAFPEPKHEQESNPSGITRATPTDQETR